MIRIQQVKIPIESVLEAPELQKETILQKKIEKLCRLTHKEILSLSIRKQSLDARKKPELFFSFVVDVEIKEEEKVPKEMQESPDFQDYGGVVPVPLHCKYSSRKNESKPSDYCGHGACWSVLWLYVS